MLPLYFTGIFLVLIHFSTGDSYPNCRSPEPNKQYIVLPQYNPTSGSIFSNDPGVAIFSNTFLQAVYNSSILLEVFDLSQATPLEYTNFVYKYNLDLYTRQGFKNAAEIAEFASRGIRNFDVLTLYLMVRVVLNTAVNFLFVEGYLTVENAKSLALAYAEAIKNYARDHLTADITSKFKVLADSFFVFMVSVDKSRTVFPISTFYFGNEWFVALVNYNWINH